ncbi:MAG: AraC family transcriptional regulator, partial [Gorillibacterium sp.]|nr:AraC family transcriptional regulator [Gorillibacterium sp.]
YIRFAHFCRKTINAAPRFIYDHEFILVMEGSGEVESSGIKVAYNPGSILMIPPGIVHSIKEFEAVESHIAIHFDWEKRPQMNDELWHFIEKEAKQSEQRIESRSIWLDNVVVLQAASKQAFALADQISMIYGNSSLYRDIYLQSYFLQLVLQLVQEIQCGEITVNELSEQGHKPARGGKERTDLLEIIRQIEALEQAECIMSAEFNEICGSAHFSESHFRRLFKEQMDMSPQAFFTVVRMRKAASLLLQTAQSIQEIAYQCGYIDSKYFSRSFRQHEGMSPLEYRIIVAGMTAISSAW